MRTAKPVCILWNTTMADYSKIKISLEAKLRKTIGDTRKHPLDDRLEWHLTTSARDYECPRDLFHVLSPGLCNW